MSETVGVLIAIVSSCLGGSAAAVTRYLVGDADAVTLAVLRWAIGFLFVLPVALVLRVRWPPRSDWLGVASLGIATSGYSLFSTTSRSVTRQPPAQASPYQHCRFRP